MNMFDRIRREHAALSSAAAEVTARQPLEANLADVEFSEFGPSQYGDSMVGALSPAQSDAQQVLEESRQRKRVNPQPGTRVLIVDESPLLISRLRRWLRQNRLEPLEAVGAARGLELAFGMQPQLIFLGVAMPGMSGFNVLRALRQDSRTAALPIIMMSGNAQATEADYLRRLGADDFMLKPFTRADVFRRIEKLLDAERTPRRRTAPVG